MGRGALALVVGFSLGALAGCASPEESGPLPFSTPPALSAGGEAQARLDWWTSFGDPALNRLVAQAYDENFNLLAAWERLQAAQAIARRESASRWPILDGTAGARFQDGGDRESPEQFSAGLAASYELDLWNEVESRVEAERLRAAASYAEYQIAAISLTAEVADTWYLLVEAQRQLDLLRKQIEVNETVLDLLETRFASGLSGSADVLRQRQLIEATREQAILVRVAAETLAHQLAILVGQPPQAELSAPLAELPTLPPLPAIGLSSELLQRRPDVLQAFLLVEAANRDLASAVGAQYPSLNITGSISSIADDPGALFDDWISTIAADLVAPLFDAGERKSEVERNAALEREALANYGQTVLVAFQEVEDALERERRQQDRIESLQRQVELAGQTFEQLRTQYLNGVTDYIAVLTALTDQQRLERDLLAAQRARVGFRIALYRALAGPFPTPRERAAEGNSNNG